MAEIPERWIELTTKRSDTYRMAIGHLAELRDAYERYIEYQKDDVFRFDILGGDELTIAASQVAYFITCTAKGNDAAIAVNKVFRENRKAVDPEAD